MNRKCGQSDTSEFTKVLSADKSPSQGGTCSHDPLIFLDFIPCSPLIKPLVPKYVLAHNPLIPKNFCTVPLIPKNVYHCSPYLFVCFTSLFIIEKIVFEPPLSSP